MFDLELKRIMTGFFKVQRAAKEENKWTRQEIHSDEREAFHKDIWRAMIFLIS